MHKVFISSRQNETKTLRPLAFRPCLRNEIDPFLFEWDVAPAEEIVEYLTNRVKESHLFVGIHKKEYGNPEIPFGENGELISPIDFELRLAIQYIGRENVRLFVQKNDERETALQSMLANKVYKEFESENEFALLLDEAIKDWKSRREDKERPIISDSQVVSIAVTCRDRPGVLASLYKVVFIHGGNIVRSHQTTHLGLASIRIIAEWSHRTDYPQGDLLKTMISQNLDSLLGRDAYKEVSISRMVDKEGLITAKGYFEVDFFDGPGIAERIFTVFARDSTSIVESSLEQITDTPPMAKFLIVANATNISREKVNMLADGIRGLAGVFRVDAYVGLGSWWY